MKLIEELFLELVRESPPLWQLKKGRDPWPSEEKSCFSSPGIPMAMSVAALMGLDPSKHTIKWENHFEGEKYGYKVKILELEIVDMIPDGITPEMGSALMNDDIPGPKEMPDPGMGEEGDDPYGLFDKDKE